MGPVAKGWKTEQVWQCLVFCTAYFRSCLIYESDVQGAASGWPTGHGKKLSNSLLCCLAKLCLAAALFLSISCGPFSTKTQTLPNLLLFVSLAHGSDLANQEISALKTKLKAMFQEIQKKSANNIPQQQAPPLPGRMNIQGDPSGDEPGVG